MYNHKRTYKTLAFFLVNRIACSLTITKHSSAFQFVSDASLFIQNKQQCKKEL